MLNFFLGVLFTLFIIWIFVNYNLNNFKNLLQETHNIKRDLELLYQEYLELSQCISSQLEEQNENLNGYTDKNVSQINTEALIGTTSKKSSGRKKAISKKTDEGHRGIISELNIKVLEMAKKGLGIKEISERTGLGQDQIAMILHLYNK